MNKLKYNALGVWASVGFAMLLASVQTGAAVAATAPPLGVAQSFAVLGGSTVTNTGPTAVTGDLGVSPGSAITGFPPGSVTGTVHAADAVALTAQNDVTTAYNTLAGEGVNVDLTGVDLGGLTLTPGVYHFATSAQLTGTLTLDAQNDPDAVFVFQMGSTLTTASNSAVVLINGAQNCNVFWQVGSSATLGTTTAFAGNILSLASITLTTGATLSGRALARNGAVTMDTNTVAVANCAVTPPIAPTLSKSFTPATINAGGVSTLTITLSNADGSVADLTAPLTDTLAGGMVVAATPNASTTCPGSGAVAATAGGTTVTLPASRSIPAASGTTAGTCTVTVDVTAPPGVHLNTLPANALQTSNGNNGAAATATLSVNAAVTLSKAFSPATINAGGVSTLTITLGNANGSVANLTASLTDTLTGGVVVAPAPNASTTCPGSGAVAASAGGTTVTLPASRSIPANGTCTVTVDVTAPAGASYVNTLAIGALATDNGSNTVPANATLVVNATPPAPSLGKGFLPASISAGGISTLTITLINPSTSIATLSAALTDNLPSGVVVAPTPNASTTCIGGTLVGPPVSGDTSVTLAAGAKIPAAIGATAGTCTVTVDVTASAGGSYVNTLGVGVLVTDQGSNAALVSAILAVINPIATPPTLSKGFIPTITVAGGVSTLTITLSNPNSEATNLTAPLTDVLPSGVVIAPTPNASTTCPGSGAVEATPGGTTVILPATRSIPGGAPGTCTVTVNVTASVGSHTNTLPANALKTTNGNNGTPATANLLVFAKPTPGPNPNPNPTGIPTLSEWGLFLLTILLGTAVWWQRRSGRSR
ncbi:IPTL-CTERM sorting domain-containing protein [Methylococcus mesophilus]|uniref:IPTL-CTERM sorting domain-containing protein n=1 Tax=Methylococcus mesophilus TaxID=2993564 RepID=UPI00224B989B|nr:IPTL-CTERM sorting domain-containing protein [Methylococcus mesophilus]UZR29791.1 IPTL-CTERM sorting domain-containing protein [Methylococcus mesophilus]